MNSNIVKGSVHFALKWVFNLLKVPVYIVLQAKHIMNYKYTQTPTCMRCKYNIIWEGHVRSEVAFHWVICFENTVHVLVKFGWDQDSALMYMYLYDG